VTSTGRSKELLVVIFRDSNCRGSGKELCKNDFLFLEGGRPLRLSCADLDHLVHLPVARPPLQRLANQYSALSAVVVRFRRSRARYEREGILLWEAAPERVAGRMPRRCPTAETGPGAPY
jgi:hypothetical protein